MEFGEFCMEDNGEEEEEEEGREETAGCVERQSRKRKSGAVGWLARVSMTSSERYPGPGVVV